MASDRGIPGTIVTVAVVTGVLCSVLCCLGLVALGFVDEQDEVAFPQLTVKSEVRIDTSTLPAEASLQDWVSLAVPVLRLNGWDLQPDLTRATFLGAQCGTSPTLNRVRLNFAGRYSARGLPSIKYGSVTLDRSANTAEVEILYQVLRWRYRPMDLSEIRVGPHEALDLADRHGGKAYRESMHDRCTLYLSIDDYEWAVGYYDVDGRKTLPDLRIRVDAKSGDAKESGDW